MSSVTPSGYKFGVTFVGTKQFSQSEAFPVLGRFIPLNAVASVTQLYVTASVSYCVCILLRGRSNGP